jgi:NADH:ubiquinone oxidoreductase subunit 6 (subunit J)
MEMFLFGLFALSAVGGALAVVLSQNVVRMAFYLVIALGSTAGLFFMLGADFVGATQLLIYVGGTVVLLIFGVMLTATGPYLTIRTSPGELIQAVFIGGAFLTMLVMTVLQVDWSANAERLESAYGASSAEQIGYHDPAGGNTSRNLGLAMLGVRPDQDLGEDEGSELSTGYLLPFEIISVHLLVVLVGAAYLARAKRKLTRVDT